MKKFVLTGGPCSGKTTLLKEIAAKGFFTMNEVAEKFITSQQAKGIAEPWKEKDFEEQIAKLQVKREKSIPKDKDAVFMDRATVDAIAYFKVRKKQIPDFLSKAAPQCKYEKVFLIEMLPHYKNEVFRFEGKDEADLIAKTIEETYKSLGFMVIKIPPVSVAERLKMIMENI